MTLATVYVRWTWSRAFLHNGWWLVTSVYLVVDAGLTPSELVLIGAAQGVVSLLCEVPAGVLADTISRKWSLVVSHLLMGTAMLATCLVTPFPAVVATQMLWGLSWTFASGADIAWITDELADPDAAAVVLVRAARAQLTGSATGMVGLGLLAWATRRDTAMVLAGVAMLLLGFSVLTRFREERFVPAVAGARWAASLRILRNGLSLVRHSRTILVIFAATFLVNGAADAAGRLYPKQLLAHGFPAAPDPVVWFATLGVVCMLAGAAALRVVQARVQGNPRRGYGLAAAAGAAGLAVLALAHDWQTGCAALLLVRGIADPLTRVIGSIWVNHRTTGEVRATVHSFLAQAEYTGEITCGATIALLAQAFDLRTALLASATLFALTTTLVIRTHAD